jgi:hypothetical protein
MVEPCVKFRELNMASGIIKSFVPRWKSAAGGG